jgi:hypothetical protein
MLRMIATAHFLAGAFGIACAMLESSAWWAGSATAFIISGIGLLLADIPS